MPARKPVEVSPEEYPPEVDLTERGKFYKRPYRMNATGRDGLTTTVAIPREIIKKSAEKKGLSPKEFMETHHAVLIYNSFDGAFITFEEEKHGLDPTDKD